MDFQLMLEEIKSLIGISPIADLNNTVALIKEELDNINWAGFYFAKDNQLILGPFVGKVACSILQFDKGVCGKAYSDNKALIVPDVNQFKGHIFCDYNSKSEIVIPINYRGKKIGVLDIDSSCYNNFDEKVLDFLNKVINVIIDNVDLNILENILFD